MEIKTYISVGTLESNDVFIELAPNETHNIHIDIQSIVLNQFGESIREEVQSVLNQYGVTSANVHINDHGALGCVIQARMETAILRAKKAVKK